MRRRLCRYEQKKNSSNSSIPPSKDENRIKKNQSLRKKSDRKIGGQDGHKGTTLEFSSKPDETMSHIPEICSNCQNTLVTDPVLVDQRQIIDIPPVRAMIYQHDYYERSCQCCGHKNTITTDDLPKTKVYYGSGIEAMIGYLSVRQFVPINRISELMRQVFGVSMSDGTVINKLASLARKCQTEYDQILSRLFEGFWVGTDETSYRMNGKKRWLWTWQNDQYTYLFPSENRGKATITNALDGVQTREMLC